MRAALAELPEAFWVTYGDTYLPIVLAPVEAAFRSAGRPALMTVLHNEDRWEPSNATVEGDVVTRYEKGASGMTHLDYGILAFRRSVFEPYPADEPFDLSVVVRDLVGRGEVTAYEVAERFHDIGTPEALADTAAWFAGADPAATAAGDGRS